MRIRDQKLAIMGTASIAEAEDGMPFTLLTGVGLAGVRRRLCVFCVFCVCVCGGGDERLWIRAADPSASRCRMTSTCLIRADPPTPNPKPHPKPPNINPRKQDGHIVYLDNPELVLNPDAPLPVKVPLGSIRAFDVDIGDNARIERIEIDDRLGVSITARTLITPAPPFHVTDVGKRAAFLYDLGAFFSSFFGFTHFSDLAWEEYGSAPVGGGGGLSGPRSRTR